MTLATLDQQYLKGRESRNVPGIKATRFHLVQQPDGNRVIAMEYHNTDVATFTADGIILNTGGFRTKTTMERIDWALSLAGIDAHIIVDQFVWKYVKSSFMQGEGNKQRVHVHNAFFDGMLIDYNGQIVNEDKAPKQPLGEMSMYKITDALIDHEPNTQGMIINMINSYIRKLSERIDNNKLDMLNESYHDLDQNGAERDNIAELVQILKDKIEMETIIRLAMQYDNGYSHFNNPELFYTNRFGEPDNEAVKDHKSIILPQVRKFFRERLVTRLVV
jgi:hypothetical protein